MFAFAVSHIHVAVRFVAVVPLLQSRALTFSLERLPPFRAEVANRIDLNDLICDVEPLTRDLNREPGAGGCDHDGHPTCLGLAQVFPARPRQDVAEDTLAFQAGSRTLEQPAKQRIGLKDHAAPRHQDTLGIPADIEGAPCGFQEGGFVLRPLEPRRARLCRSRPPHATTRGGEAFR
jgi:hypothetical protein